MTAINEILEVELKNPKPRLSLLICTLDDRVDFRERLIDVLEPQINVEKMYYGNNGMMAMGGKDVNIIFNGDHGEKTIGQKRNELLEVANGKYIAFIDDDDLVKSYYVEKVLKALETEPDVVGIHLEHYEDDVLRGLTWHSLQYRTWFDEPHKTDPNMRLYYRNPNHLNPVKREFAVKAKFPNISYCEDREYSARLLQFLNTEAQIEEPIYEYRYRPVK
jgi:glycosyltransferase involved in cell wall biosynthesis